MISEWIHSSFRLDGRSFETGEELIEYIDLRYPQGSELIRSWLSLEGTIEVKTSGSTGSPKTLIFTREQMRQSALATGKYFGLLENSKALLCLPLRYIAGKMMLVRAMTLGWWLQGTEPSVQLDLPGTTVFDFAAMVPFQVQNNLDKLDRIRNLIVGGAPVNRELQRRIDTVPTQIYATYGMTETITHVALRPLNQSSGRTDDREIYTALPGVFFEQDARGCLVIHANYLTSEAIVTNDLIELVSENRFIWKGRIDSVINSGGLKLIPEEIEHKFSDCIKGRFFATGLPDLELGQRLVFVVEGSEDAGLWDRLSRFQQENGRSIARQELPK